MNTNPDKTNGNKHEDYRQLGVDDVFALSSIAGTQGVNFGKYLNMDKHDLKSIQIENKEKLDNLAFFLFNILTIPLSPNFHAYVSLMLLSVAVRITRYKKSAEQEGENILEYVREYEAKRLEQEKKREEIDKIIIPALKFIKNITKLEIAKANKSTATT